MSKYSHIVCIGLLPKHYCILLRKFKEGSLSDEASNVPQIRTSTPINTEEINLILASLGFQPNYYPHYILPPLSISPGDIQKIAETVRDAVKDSMREEFARIVD